jgi:anti-anti-sigma factor
VIVDASKLVLIDSYAIGHLVQLKKNVEERGGSIRIRGLHGDVLDLFRDTGLAALFEEAPGAAGAGEKTAERTDDLRMTVVTETVRDIKVFHFSGVIDGLVAVRSFKEKVLATLCETRKVLLDFTELTFFDSDAIAEIVGIYKILRTSGGEMRISNAKNLVDSLLESTSLEAIVPCFHSTREALENW